MGLEASFQAYLKWAKQPSSLENALDFKRLIQRQELQSLLVESNAGYQEKEILLLHLSAYLMEMDLLQGCIAAHLCGALIEETGVKGTGNNIIDLFAKVVRLSCDFLADVQDSLNLSDNDFTPEDIRKADLQAIFQNSPDKVRAYLGCNLITLAAMAVITRDSSSRFYLRGLGIEPYLQYLQQFQENIHYVTQVYQACSELEAIVLAPSVKKGFRIVINDLNNCFHLMTLLEAELYRKGWAGRFKLQGYQWDPEIYEVAIGEQYPQRDFQISAHQQYYTFCALQPDGEYRILDASGQVQPNTLIWGEMPPEAIPTLQDGSRIIIMDTKGMFKGRSWDIGFICKCHDALEPYVHITEKLSNEEYKMFLQKIIQEKE